MNHAVTTRETLLAAAKDIACHEGMARLNVRRLAQVCGISTGAVYNYFPSKADLLFALTVDFWGYLSQDGDCPFDTRHGFLAAFAELYTRLATRLHSFETGFLQQIGALSATDKEKGRALEHACFQHLQDCLRRSLAQDDRIDPAIWQGAFTPDAFIGFAFANMMTALRSGSSDCAFLTETFARLLYPITKTTIAKEQNT